jgi:hypothetical protein
MGGKETRGEGTVNFTERNGLNSGENALATDSSAHAEAFGTFEAWEAGAE